MSHTITCPSGLTGRIRGMKVREERVLADRKLAKSGGQVDILLDRPLWIISSERRIGGGKNRNSRVQRRVDTRLGNRDRLLLHHLMNRRTILFLHFVEFVNAANALIGKDECATFERHLAGERVLDDRRRETDARRSATRRVLRSGGQAIDVAEELRFGHTRVAHQADVDGATDFHA